MIEVIPAILPKSRRDLESHLAFVKGVARVVQIDVCDGKFVPTVTWPYHKGDDDFEAILKEDQGMPYWDAFDFEIDLMTVFPEVRVEEWIQAGAIRVLIHAESTQDPKSLLEKIKKEGRIEAGIAVSIDYPNENLYPWIEDDLVKVVQCMGIDTIGVQGNPFDPKVLEKIEDIRSRYPSVIISVDGGVDFDSAPELVRAGVNRLVTGHTIFNSENPKAVIDQLANS